MIHLKQYLKMTLPKPSALLFFYGFLLILSVITVSQTETKIVDADYFQENPKETGLISLEEDLSLIPLEEQDPSINSRMLAYTVPSLGQVLGSIPLNSYSIVLSHDAKTAFVSTAEKGWLQVVDISNLESPKILATLKLNEFQGKVLALSPDGKILFASNFLSLEVIDVSNLESPKMLGSHIHDKKPDFFYSKASLAVSADGKTVFAASYGFRIFDVSDPSKIELISSEIDRWKLSAVTMHKDGKTLFFGSKTLKIYDSSDPRSLKLIYDLSTKGKIHSILLSRDSKTLFSIGEWGKLPNGEFEDDAAIVESIDVSQLTNPKILNTYPQMPFMMDPHYLLGVTSDGQSLFIRKVAPYNKLEILHLETSKFVEDIPKDILRISFMAFLPDKKTFIATNELRFFAFKLYSDIRNSVILSPQENTLQILSGGNRFIRLAWSSNNNILFTVLSVYGELSLVVIDISNPASVKPIGATDLPGTGYRDMSLSSDEKRVYISTESGILVHDVSDLTKPVSLGSFLDYDIRTFAISRDDKTAFIFETSEQFFGLKIYDISNLDSAELLSTIPVFRQNERISTRVCFSKDRKAVFVATSSLFVHDLSIPENPVLATEMQFSENDFEKRITTMTLSSDDKLLFVLIREMNIEKIKIYDVSTLSSPKLLSFINVPDKYEEEKLMVSPDNKFVYLTSDSSLGLITIDISDPSSPFLVGFTKMTSETWDAKLSNDGKMFMYTSYRQFLFITSLLPKFTLYIPTERFNLGYKYSTNVAVLQLNSERKYMSMKENYKILKISLYEGEVISSEYSITETYPTLSNWMSFDFENSILTLEPKWSNHIGIYNIYGTISKGLSIDSFDELPFIETEDDKQDLIVALIALDYLDPDYFLSANFSPNKRLMLSAKYEEESESIHKILSRYHFSTVTQIQVHPSLKVHKYSKTLLIESPNQNLINVAIQLKNPSQNSQTQFVATTYSAVHSSVTDNRSLLILDGALLDINKALKDIVINFNGPNPSHSATMTVSDGMNPSLTIDIPDIVEYFKINKIPEMKLNFQDQINKVPLFTGEYFIIELDPETFIDPTEGQLEYELSGEIPSWLNQRGLTLTGTPPEKTSPLNINLELVVKNEFKVLKVPFTIQIKISFLYALKIAGTYGGYLFTFLGILFSINKVYNIFGKKIYKHPKIFTVRVGTEITPTTIYPIGFIKEEINESKFLLKKLEDLIGKGMELVGYFTDNSHGKLNKELVTQKIDEVVQNLSVVERLEKLELYLPGINCRKEIILQQIFYEIIQRQINSNKEVFTKKVFEKIKHKWIHFLELESLSKFVVNRAKLLTELSNFGVSAGSFGLEKNHEDSVGYSFEGIRSLEMKLNDNNEALNFSLLEDALIGYGFRYQNFNRHLKYIRVMHKQKFKTSSSVFHRILGFFKLNLWQFAFADKGTVGYGIGYKIVDNTLVFYGVPHRNLKGKTLVVQITNSRGRILREVRIKGVLKEGEEENEMNSSIWEEEKEIL